MIHTTLKEFGLSDNEIRIYLTLLPLGSAASSILGKRTGIQRSTAKYTCQQLVKKGFLHVVQKKSTFIYTPEPPEKIIQNIELQKRKLDEKATKMERIVSELKTMINPEAALPKVKFFEGKDGYIQFCEEALKCKKKEILFATNMENFRNIVTNKYDTEIFIPTRLREGIFLKLFTVRSPLTEKMQSEDDHELRETRFIHKAFPFSNTIFIFDNVTTLISNEEFPSCVMITSKEITDTMRTLYEFMWQSAEL